MSNARARPQSGLVSVLASILLVPILALSACNEGAQTQAGRVAEPVQASWTAGSGLQFSGCDAIYTEARCILSVTGELVLWVPDAAPADLELKLDGATLAPGQLHAVEGGVRLGLELASEGHASEANQELEVFDRSTRRRWSLALEPASRAHRDEDYREAMRMARAGDHAGAIALLREKLSAASKDKSLRLESGVSKILFASGDYEQALDATRKVYEAALPLGRVDIANAAASRAVYIRTFLLPDFVDARAWLARIPADPSAMSTAAYQRGLLAYRLADLRAAEHEFRAALSQARPLGRPDYVRQSLEMLAQVAAQLGRSADAERNSEAALAIALTQADQPCEQASAWTNIGWARALLVAEGLAGEDPRPALREAIAGFSGEACANPRRAANARLNLAQVELSKGEFQAAGLELAAIDSGQLTPFERAWLLLLEGRLQLGLGQPGAAADALARAERLASLGDDGELQWQALTSQAEAAEALGRVDAALEAHAAAEAVLEGLVTRVALDAGRELFLAGRERAASAHVALLLDQGLSARAACVAARSQARPQRLIARQRQWAPEGERLEALAEYRRMRADLEQARADDWTLTPAQQVEARAQRSLAIEGMHGLLDQAFGGHDSELESCAQARPPAGLRLIVFPAPGERAWFSLLSEGDRVRSARVSHTAEGSEAALAQTLIGVHAASLAGRTSDSAGRPPRLGLQLHARARSLPYQAARVDGRRLDERFAVAFVGGGASEADAAQAGTGLALIVSDPSGNLRHARAESERVATILSAAGWEIERLSGNAVTADALADALSRATLFHYAGHAELGEGAGWDSLLPIASGDSFDVYDVLALPRVPRFVVLSGCETGGAGQTGWSLAQAFVTAGSASVIASTAIIADHHAAAVSEALVANLDLDDAGMTLWRARQQLDASAAAATSTAFRAWEREDSSSR